jgi:hypothetical protein
MALSWRAIVVSWLACGACGPSLVGDDGGSEGGTDTDPSNPSTTATATATDPTSATATDPTTATTDPTATATDPSASATVTATDPTVTTDPSFTATATVSATDPTATTDPTDTDTGGDLPNGSECAEDSDCESGHCFDVGVLGSICGECELDSDCPGGGCTPPNPLSEPPVGSLCNAGEYGAGCMSDDACQAPLQCALVIDVPGVIAASTCGECVDDVDCDPGLLCAPDIAVVGVINGVKRCVAQGSLVNGQSCDFTTSGDASCASGICAVADVMGFLFLGVCSQCEVDSDCPGQICQPPQVDLMTGIVPGVCGM